VEEEILEIIGIEGGGMGLGVVTNLGWIVISGGFGT
jgi:hypothetical protein